MTLERGDLSRDSICVNGLWLEDIINGFHILSSTGRETLTKEVVTTSYKKDGSVYNYTRFPERIIQVSYVIDGSDSIEFRENCTDLYRLLNIENAQIQFNDEFDKFYTGTISLQEPEEKYGLVYSGIFDIVCTDPFKYSTAVYEAEPVEVNEDNAQFLINYNGTYPAHPVLQASFAGALEGGTYSDDGDCGYVAWMDEYENIIQTGNPDAIDLDASKVATTLQNNYLSSLSAFTTTGTLNTGQTINDQYWKNGTGYSKTFVKHSGSASFTYNVSGGAQNFELSIIQRMCCNKTTEKGEFYVYCYDANDTIVCGYKISKTASGTTGKAYYFVNGNTSKSYVNINLGYYNTNYGYCKRTKAEKIVETKYYWNVKTKKWQTKAISGAKTKIVKTGLTSGYEYTQSNLNSYIKKSGKNITFKLGNLTERSFSDLDIETTPIVKVKVGFTGALHTNAIRLFKLVRNVGQSFTDQDNVFTAGQTVQADCNDGSIYIMEGETDEGRYCPEYGALGNDWEDFTLQPGANIIQAVWSPWVDEDYKPELKIIYNQKFI